ncbi:MAG: LytR/AlgR family response regulator transcription factor [Acidobacteriota bacterium]
MRVVIADDEALARARIRSMLENDPEVEVVAECPDGRSAVDVIQAERPDIVFLDIQMPELDGFQVVEEIAGESAPAVVFVTAFDQYALRAFQVHAIDYLLKPFDRGRFAECLARAKAAAGRSGMVSERLLALIEELRGERKSLERVIVRSGGRVSFVKVSEIDWIEASGNYLRLHCGQTVHLIRDTMNAFEGRLDPQTFMRIHRSTMVNIERIRELQPWFHGDYMVILVDGTKLTLSRSYRHKLDALDSADA